MRIPTTIYGDVYVIDERFDTLCALKEVEPERLALVRQRTRTFMLPLQSLLLEQIAFDGENTIRVRMTAWEYAVDH